MKKANKSGIPESVKHARQQKGLTQSNLAELSGLSLRSIQRIENGEVTPRAYSMNRISEILELQEPKGEDGAQVQKTSISRKLILSIGSLIILFLSAMAFLSQSADFPENDFEMQVYWIVVVIIICLVQWFIWGGKIWNQKD